MPVAQYWRDYYLRVNGIDCGHCSNQQRKKCKADDLFDQCPRAIKIESLQKPITDGDGHLTELGELIADDKSIDLDQWLDTKTFLLGCPMRLVQIAYKRYAGIPLNETERRYFNRQKQIELKKYQKALL